MSDRVRDDRARWWKRRVIGSGALLVLVAAALVFSLIATDPGDNVTLVETGVEMRGPERFVTGAIRNNTDGAFARVRIEFVLLGADGATVENISATMLNLAADETRNFETQVLADRAVRFRVEGLTCSRDGETTDPKMPPCYIPPEKNQAPYAGDL